MGQKDRLQQLLQSTTLNGIDFVEIASVDQTALRVHFLNTVALAGTVSNPTITGGETIPTVSVKPIDDATDWSTDVDGRPILSLTADAAGDFSFYTLTLVSSNLDPFFSSVQFSFKALCPSDQDCQAAPVVCPPLSGDTPPIDYLAKDFLSFRKALSDFSALRYPEWQERSEADFGVMFMEALCSLADDLSYTQDRIAAEGTLDTATQRRSIVRHARLVDYEPQPATAAQVLLQFDVLGGPIPSGLSVSATGPDGSSVKFEAGTGLIDPTTGLLNTTTYPVSSAWNRFLPSGQPNILPYYWDDSQSCLRAGSTEMWVLGHGFNFTFGQGLLIDTQGQTTADPRIREVVHLTSADEETDQLFNQDVTHIVWGAVEALQFDHDLTLNPDNTPRTLLAGNLIPATQGQRYTESFAIDTAPPSAPQTPLALVRTGPNSTPDSPVLQYLYTLQNGPLAWLAQSDSNTPPLPEILLEEQPPQPATPTVAWTWRRKLLDAQEFEEAFTVDPVSFIRTAGNSDGSSSYDYDGDTGDTIRFGDDIFGEIPESDSVFTVTYCVGVGVLGNVAADSITTFDPTSGLISAVTNPFPAAGGADEEPDETVRRLAPQAFRAQRLYDVRPEDYQATAETLPWVLRAGTVFRWTGSWLTVFTTADPTGTEQISLDEQTGLIDLLNRYRLAGYESYVPAPVYVGIDLTITVCANPDAFRADVQAALLSALSTSKLPDGTTGFFYLDRFTFGTPLDRSALEAAIQASYGVAGVVSIQYRQRGATPGFIDFPDTLSVAPNQILRVDNDPSRPERGLLNIIVRGGK
jgi:Baseplate J-like protein